MAIAKGEIKAFIKSKKITKVSNGVPTYGKDIETIENRIMAGNRRERFN
jgi:hypothetical protein